MYLLKPMPEQNQPLPADKVAAGSNDRNPQCPYSLSPRPKAAPPRERERAQDPSLHTCGSALQMFTLGHVPWSSGYDSHDQITAPVEQMGTRTPHLSPVMLSEKVACRTHRGLARDSPESLTQPGLD